MRVHIIIHMQYLFKITTVISIVIYMQFITYILTMTYVYHSVVIWLSAKPKNYKQWTQVMQT